MDSTRMTISVEEAGKLLGLGRSASYDAARRGELPVISIGRRKLVSLPALERMIENPQGWRHGEPTL